MVIREHDRVVPLLASGNRDEEVFPDPQRFDPNRFADNPGRQFGSSGEVLPFGAGPHHCTGSRLGEVEMAHAFEKLFGRVERLTAGGRAAASEGFILHSPPSLPGRPRAAGLTSRPGRIPRRPRSTEGFSQQRQSRARYLFGGVPMQGETLRAIAAPDVRGGAARRERRRAAARARAGRHPPHPTSVWP